jgi:ATPase subunit of ABC transporter with duplicated ATPase domains
LRYFLLKFLTPITKYSPLFVGKSTLLSALSGRLVPIDGLRTEGDGLELGVFTQDLAQDLVRTLLEGGDQREK